MRILLSLALSFLLLHAACAKREPIRGPSRGNPPPAEAKAPPARPAGQEPAAPSPQKVDLSLDAAGELSALAATEFGKDFPEGEPPARKSVAWAELPSLFASACEAAPRDYSDVRVSKELHPESGPPQPVILVKCCPPFFRGTRPPRRIHGASERASRSADRGSPTGEGKPGKGPCTCRGRESTICNR